MLEKLARTRSKLGPKIRAEARTRSSSGFQYSYSLGAQDFDAQPIPIRKYSPSMVSLNMDFTPT